MATVIDSIRTEFARYRKLAEDAVAQLSDAELSASGPNGSSSIATIGWHISGNLRSRFTDFLTSDGEKPWRNRESEFEARSVSRDQFLAKWNDGWDVLMAALSQLTEADLARTVTIRSEPAPVHAALHRALAHVSYHVGQMVYAAKAIRGGAWTYLSIPPGQSDRFNQTMRARGDSR